MPPHLLSSTTTFVYNCSQHGRHGQRAPLRVARSHPAAWQLVSLPGGSSPLRPNGNAGGRCTRSQPTREGIQSLPLRAGADGRAAQEDQRHSVRDPSASLRPLLSSLSLNLLVQSNRKATIPTSPTLPLALPTRLSPSSPLPAELAALPPLNLSSSAPPQPTPPPLSVPSKLLSLLSHPRTTPAPQSTTTRGASPVSIPLVARPSWI